MYDFENTEITPYQKQKVRDFVSAVNKSVFQDGNLHTYEIASDIAAKTVPYIRIVDHVNTYLASFDSEIAYANWVEKVKPSYFEDLFFHAVIIVFKMSEFNPVPVEAKTEWLRITDMILTYVDGENWDTFLSDTDKMRELSECLSVQQIADCLQISEEHVIKIQQGEEELDLIPKTVLDAVHRVYEQAITVFAVNALAQLWFETPDNTKVTPLERLKRSGPIEQAQLIARLKNPAVTEE